MNKIYEVRSIARSDGKTHSWGARYSRAEAEALLAKRTERRAWVDKYHERWWIEEIDTTGLFKVPPAPPPRDRFSTKITQVESGDGKWNTLHVDVLNEASGIIATYDRNYPNSFRTFEPFRQGGRMMALISIDYAATAVMDLATNPRRQLGKLDDDCRKSLRLSFGATATSQNIR